MKKTMTTKKNTEQDVRGKIQEDVEEEDNEEKDHKKEEKYRSSRFPKEETENNDDV